MIRILGFHQLGHLQGWIYPHLLKKSKQANQQEQMDTKYIYTIGVKWYIVEVIYPPVAPMMVILGSGSSSGSSLCIPFAAITWSTRQKNVIFMSIFYH